MAASGSAAMSWPLTTMRPEVGCSSPAIMRSVVVLPAPLGPRNPWISPGGDVEADAVHGRKAAVALDEVRNRNHRSCTGSRRPPALVVRMAAPPARAAGAVRRAAAGVGASSMSTIGHLQPADERHDDGLLVEAAAGQPQVRGVGRELVERRDRPAATGRGRRLRRCRPRATRGNRTRPAHRGRRRGRRRCARGCRAHAPSPRTARCARCSRRPWCAALRAPTAG